MDVSKVTRDELILAGVALLSTATESPDGWLGGLAVLTALALMAYLTVERLASVEPPAINGSVATTRLVLAAVTAGFVALKFLLHIHFGLFGIGFWGAVVLAAALVAIAARARDVAGMTPGIVGRVRQLPSSPRR